MSGFFGVASKESCAEALFYGTDYQSHLGTAFGGMAVLGDEFVRQIHDISQSQFKSKFVDDISRMNGNTGIGVISDSDEQPIYMNSKLGPFCIVTDGFIENKEALADKLMKKGISFSEVSNGSINMTELIGKLINLGSTIVDGIDKMFAAIEGSCSLLVLNHDGIYAARDRLGYNPLIVGQKNGSYSVTTETSAFPNSGYEIVKYLEPGEICLVKKDGIEQKKKGGKHKQFCSFLWIYTGFPASNYEGINAEIVRERCGKCLAKCDKDLKLDMVAGVPDSGMGHAVGYAMESKVPLRRPLVKYTPGYGRSYVPPTQATRDLVARMKLIPNEEIIKNNRIVICEDSIVRGTQLKNHTIKKFWDAAVKEVHVRVACPPLMFPCRFNLSTRSINELAARKAIRSIEGHDLDNVGDYLDSKSDKYKKMVDWIKKDLEVSSLKYLNVDDMIESIGIPKEDLCLYCWNGTCP